MILNILIRKKSGPSFNVCAGLVTSSETPINRSWRTVTNVYITREWNIRWPSGHHFFVSDSPLAPASKEGNTLLEHKLFCRLWNTLMEFHRILLCSLLFHFFLFFKKRTHCIEYSKNKRQIYELKAFGTMNELRNVRLWVDVVKKCFFIQNDIILKINKINLKIWFEILEKATHFHWRRKYSNKLTLWTKITFITVSGCSPGWLEPPFPLEAKSKSATLGAFSVLEPWPSNLPRCWWSTPGGAPVAALYFGRGRCSLREKGRLQ